MPLIKRNDIIESGDPLKELKQSLIDTQKYVDKLTGSNKQLAIALQLVKKTNDGNEAKKLIDQTKELTNSTIKLKDAKTASVRVEEQILKANKKLVESQRTESKQLAELKVKQSELNKQTKQSARDRLGLVSLYEKESKKLTDLRKKYKDLALQNKQNTKEGKKLLANITKLDKKLKAVDKTVGQSQRSVGHYGLALKNLGKNLIGSLGVVGGLTAFVSIMKGAAKISMEFSKSSSRLAAILGKSKDAIKGLTNQAKLLGSTTAFTASNVIELQTELAKLGFSLEEIQNATPGILDLAAATGQDLAQSAELAGATLRIFNLDATEMQRVTDVLAKSTTISSLSMEKLATIMPTVGKTAHLAGVSLEKTAALAGTLTDRGLDASSAATSLRNIFLELSKKGITWNEAMEKINNSTDKNKASMDLFGKRAAAAGVILSETGQSVDKLTTSLNNSNGAAKEMADTMLNNLSGDITKASSAWEGFILSLESGNGVISKVLRSATQHITGFLSVLAKLNEGMSLWEIRARKTGSLTKGLSKDTQIYTNELKKLKTDEEKLNYVNEKSLNIRQKLRGNTHSLHLTEKKLNEAKKNTATLLNREVVSLRKTISQLKFNEIAYNEKLKILNKLKPVAKAEIEQTEKSTEEINKNTIALNKQLSDYEKLNKQLSGLKTEYTDLVVNQKEGTDEARQMLDEITKLEIKLQNINDIIAKRPTFAEAGQAETVSPISQIQTITTVDTSEFEKTKYDDLINYKEQQDKVYSDKKKAEAIQREIDIRNAEKAIKEQAITSATALASDIYSVHLDEKLAKLQTETEAEKAILQDQLDKGVISETEYKSKIEALNNKMRQKEATAEKKKALFDIGIQTAVNVAKVLANPIAVAAVLALGAIQAATVLATPLPQYEEGGEVGGELHSNGGTIIEAEKREFVVSRTGYAGAENITQMINKGLIKDADIDVLSSSNYSLQSLQLNGLINKFEENISNTKKTNDLLKNVFSSYRVGNKEYIKETTGKTYYKVIK